MPPIQTQLDPLQRLAGGLLQFVRGCNKTACLFTERLACRFSAELCQQLSTESASSLVITFGNQSVCIQDFDGDSLACVGVNAPHARKQRVTVGQRPGVEITAIRSL
jgi:hypothetical protein